jgi:hypothetical protein
MAELFSLMLESTSCKSDRVEANRDYACLYSRALPMSEEPCLTVRGAALSEIWPSSGTGLSLWPFFSVAADGPSAIGESRCWLRQTAQKSMTKKAAKRNPSSQIWQHFHGVYFLTH